jgi:hypothetical protein
VGRFEATTLAPRRSPTGGHSKTRYG